MNKMYPTTKAINGEKIKPCTIFIKPEKRMASKPADAITDPAIAPIIAWEELLGIPKYQVIKFQAMAAINAAKITVSPLFKVNGSAIPLEMVFATPVKVSAPRKFINAAIMTAVLGGKALVDTEVAIALAVS